MKLVHFSSTPLNLFLLVSKSQLSGLYNGLDKPAGLWLSDEDDRDWSWSAWVSGNMNTKEYRNRFRFENKIEFKEDANILKISNVEEFDIFHDKYSFSLPSDHFAYQTVLSYGEIQHKFKTSNDSAVEISKLIDWKRVAKEYQGILITPYVYERRTSRYWYYPWDCAGGCIWDTSCIASIEASKYDTTTWEED